ncbi:MAG: SDR family oxidoreductase [Endozoicomonas sp.]
MSYQREDVSGLSCLITGATSGIGTETARGLAEQGVKLTILCRSQAKGEQLREELISSTGNQNIDLLVADMASLEQVNAAAQEYLDSGKPLDLLINNAGVVNTSRKLTVDGYEEMFAVNHLAPFLLTNCLLPLLKKSDYGRIVNVASDAHHFVRGMEFDDLQSERKYKTISVYGRSKLGNILFMNELVKRLGDSPVTMNSLHPGAVSTGLGLQNDGILSRIVPKLLKPFFKTPAQGAETTLYMALASEMKGVTGGYYANCKPGKMKPWAKDDEAAEKLWKVSQGMVHLEETV